MCSTRDDAALPALGLPIRRSAAQRLFSASPRLIAAVHVLLRLLVPRHPPLALTILTVSTAPRSRARRCVFNPFFGSVQFSSSAEAGRRSASVDGPSKLSSAARYRVYRHRPGPVDIRECLPRKEVIQPQLPLRLPCYDFTPITGPTFDGSLPKGLGHRLRVLLAFVV